MTIKPIGVLIGRAFKKYLKDDPIRLSGTTAFFMVMALFPIIIIITTMAGILISESTMQEKILTQAQSLIGTQGKQYIEMLIDNYNERDESSLKKTLIGVAIFLGISTTFFSVVQNAINYIWRVRSKPENNFLKALKDRLLSFGLILSIGLIMLVSLIIDAGIAILDDFLSDTFPDATVLLIKVLNVIFSFGVVTVIFAMIYKFLPDARIKWKVTWIGALITAFLFTVGKYLIGMLLGSSGIGDMYGAAGSIIIVLLWLFYSSIIFYFGAEITQQYAAIYFKGIRPKAHAVRIEISEIRQEE